MASLCFSGPDRLLVGSCRGCCVAASSKIPFCVSSVPRREYDYDSARGTSKCGALPRILSRHGGAAGTRVARGCKFTVESSETQSVVSVQWNIEEKNGNGRKEPDVSSTTKYLDEKLSRLLYSSSDSPVRQIVLVTDGTDNRPYRLNWPSPSVIFDVSPGHVHNVTLRKMTASGWKLPRSCLVQHVPEDILVVEDNDDDWGEKLLKVGYSGDKPSVWVLEMRNNFSEGHLQKILPVASSLLMKDSVFIGLVPVITCEVETIALMRKLFANNGFLAEFVVHGKVDLHLTFEGSAKPSSSNTPNDNQPPLLTFFARQLRLSDAQVEYARLQIMMAEEEGDEEGFVDAW